MKVLFFILEKEFRQIFRNKAMLPIIFVIPVVQLMILSFAVDYEIKNLKLTVVDADRGVYSRKLTEKFTASGYFHLLEYTSDNEEAANLMHGWKTDVILVIPNGFDKDLMNDEVPVVQLRMDAVDGTKAGMAAGYSQAIIRDFIFELVGEEMISMNKQPEFLYKGEVIPINYYNPYMNYKVYMVPGILAILVTMVGAFLSSMNIVREKELGTIEQINVTPIARYQFILGKTIPFWVIGLFEFSIGLVVARLVFDIHVEGSLFVLYFFTSIYLFLILGFGLLISTVTATQQQAMFISWFFLVIFLLMGGLFTPVENMPDWAQKFTYVNPVRFFIEVLRGIMLKGAGFTDLLNQFMLISGYAILLIWFAVRRYKKVDN